MKRAKAPKAPTTDPGNTPRRFKVFLGGEGSNELGTRAQSWHRDASEHRPGALEVLAKHKVGDCFEVVGAIQWKDIRKYKAGKHVGPEAQSVLGLALKAKEREADVVLFMRDQDGSLERQKDVMAGLETARRLFPTLADQLVGGLAIRMLESWVLAASGVRGTEAMGKDTLEAKFRDHFGLALKDKSTEALVTCLERADVSNLPDDATSLRDWLEQLVRVMGPEG